jgi:hypothetical protein
MVRAHLAVSEGLLHAFQQPDPARLLLVKIEGEALELAAPPIAKKSDDGTDFQTLVVEGVLQASPTPTSALLIFSLDDGTRVLVKYLGLSCPVREKMLYSSSVTDLKRGLSCNVSLFEAHEREDVTFEGLLEALGKRREAPTGGVATMIASAQKQKQQPAPLPLTKLEDLSLTERGMERDTGVRLHGMSRLSFEVHTDVKAAVAKVLAADEPENWLELALAKGTVVVTALRSVSFPAGNGRMSTIEGDLSTLLPTGEPRFLIVAHDKAQHLFIYSCPQSAPIKQKFAYSTAKQVVVEALGAAKAFDRVVEVGDADDLAQALAHLPSTSEEDANTSTSGTAALQLEHLLLARVRPRGPGRPQPRVVEE